jgi:hypothetical protein
MVRDIARGLLVSRTVRCDDKRESLRSILLSRITRPLSADVFDEGR